ncbi:hypothetical protein EDD85DRAFT_962389 [Armillaria nabsnona]|nr:hypothetical protein EDD85DRAFT_962389 [Armillaria nabsnona]
MAMADSAVDRVPTEVWEEIFLFTVADAEEDAFDIAQTNDGPWVLCQVRHDWRTIASSLPRLWSKFTLWADATTVRESRRTHHLLNIAIPRSTIHPLDFSVVIVDNDAAQVVLPHLVELGTGTPRTSLTQLSTCEAFTRKAFGRQICRGRDWKTYPSLVRIGHMDGIELLRNTSQLRELEITEEFLLQTPVLPPMALVHNSLQILRISDPLILRLLQAPSLIELEFFDYVVSEPSRDEFATISAFLLHCPLLAKLAITVDYLDVDLIRAELVSRMTRLRKLELTILCNHTEDGSCIFVDFMQPMLVVLVQLTIKGNVQILLDPTSEQG